MKIDDDSVYVFKNFFTKQACKKYSNTIKDIGFKEWPLPFEERVQDITNDPVVQVVKDFLNQTLNINLKISQAQTQNWHVNSYSELHVHDSHSRMQTKYNSLIYLNDDFEGGEFITEGGLKLKPEQGMLTFFNGQVVKHGTNKVFGKDRKTLIFWWKDV